MLLDEKTTALVQAQQQNDTQTNTIKELRDELEKADLLLKEVTSYNRVSRSIPEGCTDVPTVVHPPMCY